MTLLIPMLLPILIGLILPLLSRFSRVLRLCLCIGVQTLSLAGTVWIALRPASLDLWHLDEILRISFASDGIGNLFAILVSFGWLIVGIYSVRYLDEYPTSKETRFLAFYMLSEGVLLAMCYADNLFSMYLFFELVTLLSMPLVLQDGTEASLKAALKYLFYSVAGAIVALMGILLVCGNGGLNSLNFVAGGTQIEASPRVLWGVFLMCVGFAAKAGLYPLHGWLPSAHPVAPSPASAVLSGLIAKAGVLALIRVLFYLINPILVAGTWVQTTLLILALITVLMGSVMAYREQLFKRRLAYSSVSQISYALVGIFMLNQQALAGALLQVVFHALVKIALFLSAGAVIYSTHKTQVPQLHGIGRHMPLTMGFFTLAALSLIGIPPTGGFLSKWHLCLAAMDSQAGAFSWLIPVVLLVSALLTAAYLLSISVDAFFPGKNHLPDEGEAVGMDRPIMWIPIALLAVVALLLGMFADMSFDFVNSCIAGLFEV